MQPYEEKKIIKYVMQVSVKMHKWFNEVMGLKIQIKNIHAYIYVCIKKKKSTHHHQRHSNHYCFGEASFDFLEQKY